MYTPENDHNDTPVEHGTNESSKGPAPDPSYNPYLQEKKPDTPAVEENVAEETTQSDAPSQGEESKTSSWESGTLGAGGDPVKKCPFCGAVLRDGANFCVSCGRSLRTAQTQSNPNGYTIPGAAPGSRPNQNPHGTPVPPPQEGFRELPHHTPIDPNVPELLSVLDYFVLFLVTSIPVVGVILALYWGFSSQTGVNRKNFARTILILRVIQYVFMLLYALLIVGLLHSGNAWVLGGTTLF